MCAKEKVKTGEKRNIYFEFIIKRYLTLTRF